MAIFSNLYVPDEWDGYNFRLPPAQRPGFSTRSKSETFDLILKKISHPQTLSLVQGSRRKSFSRNDFCCTASSFLSFSLNAFSSMSTSIMVFC